MTMWNEPHDDVLSVLAGWIQPSYEQETLFAGSKASPHMNDISNMLL